MPHFEHKKSASSSATQLQSQFGSKPAEESYSLNSEANSTNVYTAADTNTGTSDNIAESTKAAPAQKVNITEIAKAYDEARPKIKNSRECIYTKLNEMQKRVFDAMPYNEAVPPDKIAQSGIPAADVLSSLTILELLSAVEMLPGGIYKKII